MTRPLRFRAWDGRQMCDIATLSFNSRGMIWYAAAGGAHGGWGWINPEYTGWNVDDVKPNDEDVCPVMQWTGLKDSKGVDIWEGDILVDKRGNKWPVDWISEKDGLDWTGFRWCGVEVIGNIYQHADLLKS